MAALLAFLGRLRRDRRGVSAIEFALIAPVMILFYFGLAELCQAYMAQKRMAHSAAAVADLVAQTDVVTKDELADISAIGALIMKPYAATTLTTRISSVTRNSSGVVKVDWVYGTARTALARGDTVTVPADTIAKGESLVMVESGYTYESPVKYIIKKATTFSNKAYLRPRRVDMVGCSDC